MKCPNCGSELEPGKIYCEHCGHEIQIVPDYDPLDEVLIGQEEPEEMKPDSFPVSEESGTTAGKGEKRPVKESELRCAFAIRVCSF